MQADDHQSHHMSPLPRARLVWLAALFVCLAGAAQEVLPGTQPLTLQGDLSAQMVAGIDKFFMRELEQSLAGREIFWHRDLSSPQAYEASVRTNRAQLRKIIGVADERLPFRALDFVSSTASPAQVAETDAFTAKAVRWPVLDGVYGEGLFLEPKGTPVAFIVAIPDADQSPEMLAGLVSGLAPERQFARRLAENGCAVLVPTLINRQDTWSSKPRIKSVTNLPHREWIYRQAFPLGRHIIGYEVQKVLAAVDFFDGKWQMADGKKRKIGVAGYGEGGLIAFYAAAVDRRIAAVLVSGYFDSRQRIWQEPIYRNVFGLLREFGDAEIASLIAPRDLVVEYSKAPQVDGPPKPRTKKPEAAPGKITTPDYTTVETEFERARALLKAGDPKAFDRFKLISGTEGMTTGPGSDRALLGLLNGLDVAGEQLKPAGPEPTDLRVAFHPISRQQQQVKELEEFTQKLLRESERQRGAFFWHKVHTSSVQEWETACAPFRQVLWEEVTGRLPSPALPANPRTRRWAPPAIPATATNQSSATVPGSSASKLWTGYEVVLDVYPDVFAWGILLLPNDLKPGERRPVVVCQHGLEGVPAAGIPEDPARALATTKRLPGVWLSAASLSLRRTIPIAARRSFASCSGKPTRSRPRSSR